MDLQGNILELIADDTVSVSNIYDASVAYLQTAPLNADTRAAAQLFSDTIATARTKPDVANALYTFSTTINQRTGKLLAPTVAETVVMPVQQTVVQSISVLGFYGPSMVQDGSFMVYFTEPTQGTVIGRRRREGVARAGARSASSSGARVIGPGWTISGLTGISGNVTVVQYTSNVYGDVVINAGPPAISFPYVSNAVVVSDMPNNIQAPSSIMRLTLSQMSANDVPKVFSNATTSFGLKSYDVSAYDTSNIKGIFTELRELNSNVGTSEGLNELKTIV